MLVLIDCYGCEHIKTMDCHLSCSNKDIPIKSYRTNADRIRAMSDEELAEMITHPKQLLYCCFEFGNCGDDCSECALKWLKKEVDK